MKRIIRKTRLSTKEAKANETIRKQVAQEMPAIVARHHRTLAAKARR